MAYFQSAHALIALSLLIFLTGCSSVPKQADDRGKNYYSPGQEGVVMLQPRESGQLANDQPVELEPERLETLLANIYYPEARRGLSGWISNSERRTPVIQETNLGRLSRAISRALTDAGPDEDVVVGLRQADRDGSGSIRGYHLTVFRAFVVDNRLNLLLGTAGESLDDSFRFDTIHRKAQAEGSPSGIDPTQVKTKAGSRSTAPDTAIRVLYTGVEATVKRLRDDWIALDLTRGAATPAPASESSPDAQPQSGDSSAISDKGEGEKSSVTPRNPATESDPETETGNTAEERSEKLLRKELIYL